MDRRLMLVIALAWLGITLINLGLLLLFRHKDTEMRCPRPERIHILV